MKKRIQLVISGLAAIVVVALVFQACSKDELSASGSTQNLKVYITDDPAQLEKLLVQINTVEVKLDTGKHRGDDDWGRRDDDDDDDDRRGYDDYGHWDTLSIAAGEYDILSLRNGVDTLLAQGNVQGTVRKLRISVGNITVVKDGISYPVSLLPGNRNYIYVKLGKEHIRANGNNIATWVDFDVSRSIIEINGKYYLKPVLKPFCDNNFGKIEGEVKPADARAVIQVYNSSDTATAIPDRDGEFKIRGLAPGTYSVRYDGSNGYADTTIVNVVVAKGKETELPEVILRK
jgi:hypothetical protein